MTSPTRHGEPPVPQPTNESPLPAAEKGTKVRRARHLSQEQDLRGTRNWVIKISSISVQYFFINVKNTQWTQNRILKTLRMRITDISLASASTMAYTTLLLILCSFKTWYFVHHEFPCTTFGKTDILKIFSFLSRNMCFMFCIKTLYWLLSFWPSTLYPRQLPHLSHPSPGSVPSCDLQASGNWTTGLPLMGPLASVPPAPSPVLLPLTETTSPHPWPPGWPSDSATSSWRPPLSADWVGNSFLLVKHQLSQCLWVSMLPCLFSYSAVSFLRSCGICTFNPGLCTVSANRWCSINADSGTTLVVQ